MPRYNDAYNEALLKARREALGGGGLRDEALRRLYREYAAMLVRLQADADAGLLSAERAAGLRRSIEQEMLRLEKRINRVLDAAMQEAARLAAAGHEAGLAAASDAAGVTVAHEFTNVPTRALEGMMRRRAYGGAATFQTLVRRRLGGMAADVDALLSSGVARGISNEQLTKELGLLLSQDDPQLHEAMKSLGPKGGRTLKAIQEGVVVPDVQVRQAKSLLHDLRRIAVSEINSAYTEAHNLANAESPVVDLVQWTLSIRHASLGSSPDVCDIVAEADPHGYGPGIYHPETVPPLLHPYCQCWCRAVLRPPEEWGDPKRPAPIPREITEEEAGRILAKNTTERSRKITERFAAAQRERANVYVGSAGQVVGRGRSGLASIKSGMGEVTALQPILRAAANAQETAALKTTYRVRSNGSGWRVVQPDGWKEPPGGGQEALIAEHIAKALRTDVYLAPRVEAEGLKLVDAWIEGEPWEFERVTKEARVLSTSVQNALRSGKKQSGSVAVYLDISDRLKADPALHTELNRGVQNALRNDRSGDLRKVAMLRSDGAFELLTTDEVRNGKRFRLFQGRD